jgi:(p)ppGpp synthase/HD superfamily hydrolase
MRIFAPMMTKDEFQTFLDQQSAVVAEIRERAHEVHRQVNQSYGDGLPYGYHLDMVAMNVREFGYLVCVEERDMLPLFFGAFFHDSIEDARLTYNDVKRLALQWMDDREAAMATEIVYALTNDKGRTRSERAGDRYYAGVRETPYAPFVKLCDRLANIAFSCSNESGINSRMRETYREELPHFLTAIDGRSTDRRFAVPETVVQRIKECLESLDCQESV